MVPDMCDRAAMLRAPRAARDVETMVGPTGEAMTRRTKRASLSRAEILV